MMYDCVWFFCGWVVSLVRVKGGTTDTVALSNIDARWSGCGHARGQ